MNCSLDIDKAVPELFIMKWRGAWWQCNENGKRLVGVFGQKCRFGWNGAHAYLDPSF